MGITHKYADLLISIHAPRTGSDRLSRHNGFRPQNISIHAPRTGSDSVSVPLSPDGVNFNPRSPHGERQENTPWEDEGRYFNPRSPHGERRPSISPQNRYRHFNPRSPHGERPPPKPRRCVRTDISIHAPRTGSDRHRLELLRLHDISIHAPRTGSDCFWRNGGRGRGDFNPRSPHGERHEVLATGKMTIKISIHAPRTGSDKTVRLCIKTVYNISIHAPRTGSDAS